LESFELGDAQQRLHEFIWNDYCDWYIEMAKIRLRNGSAHSPLPTLAHVLERILRLLHPFMPFITEEIWQNLRSKLPEEGDSSESIMISPYPQVDRDRQEDRVEEEMTAVMRTIRAVRNTRAQLRIPANQLLEAIVEADGLRQAVEEESEVICALSRVEPLRVLTGSAAQESGVKGVTLVVNPLVVRLALEGIVDLSLESQRLQEERSECVRNLDRVSTLVSNPDFRAKARPEVVENEEERLRSLQERRDRLDEILAQLAD
jgi:valyl-tRNA synthetase